MAKRISSILSLSSNHSDQSSDSRLGSSVHPARPPKEQSPPTFARKSMNDLRPTSDLQNLHNTHHSGPTPPFNPTVLPPIQDDDSLLQRPQYLSPFPPRSDSTGGNRPTSGASSRPNSMDDTSLQHPSFLKPLPVRSESSSGSRPVSTGSGPEGLASPPLLSPSLSSSRPSSPNTIRPPTPAGEHKLSKRKSWIPGRSRAGSQSVEDGPHDQQAWIVTPKEMFPYDTTALANFHPVSTYQGFVQLVI